MSAVPIDPVQQSLLKILSKVNEIAVLPQVVYKVMEMTGSEETSTASVEKAIEIDPGFSTKLLTQANSAYYGLPKKVTSIREAVMFLGFKTVRQLAMTVGIFDLFLGKTDEESLRRRGWWRHSLDSAVACKWLAMKFKNVSHEEAYTSGLLHYIGKTLLDRHATGEYAKVVALMGVGKTDLEAERMVYGCHHVEVSMAVMAFWKFPGLLIESMDYINEPQEPGPGASLRYCVALGDAIARFAIQGSTENLAEHLQRMPLWAIQGLGIEDSKIEEIIHGATEAIALASKVSL